jgi:hypothetical protein
MVAFLSNGRCLTRRVAADTAVSLGLPARASPRRPLWAAAQLNARSVRPQASAMPRPDRRTTLFSTSGASAPQIHRVNSRDVFLGSAVHPPSVVSRFAGTQPSIAAGQLPCPPMSDTALRFYEESLKEQHNRNEARRIHRFPLP